MLLNTSTTSFPARKRLGTRRMAHTFAAAAKTVLIAQARRIRLSHASFVLGLTLAVAGALSVEGSESGASSARQQEARQPANRLNVSTMPGAPIDIVLVDSLDEAKQLIAESYHFQTEASGFVVLPTVRVIDSTETENQVVDELSIMALNGVDYRLTDLRAKQE